MRSIVAILAVASASLVSAAETPDWWNPQWRFRTTLERPTPDRDEAVRPVEVVVDFARLLHLAGLPDAVDPDSLRVVQWAYYFAGFPILSAAIAVRWAAPRFGLAGSVSLDRSGWRPG